MNFTVSRQKSPCHNAKIQFQYTKFERLQLNFVFFSNKKRQHSLENIMGMITLFVVKQNLVL